MSSPDLEDLATRLFDIARALANGEDPLQGQLQSLLSIVDQQAKRIEDAVTSAGNAAKAELDHLAAAAASTLATAQQSLEDATKVWTAATQRIGDELTSAVRTADQAKAAAQRGLDQAAAVGGAALQQAQQTRDQLVAAADRALADAQQRAADARAAADAALAQVQQLVDDALAALTKAEHDAVATIAELGEKARQQITDAFAQAQQLAGQVTALADDTLHKIEGALAWPAGILSLVAKVLRWLHKEVLHGDPHVAVVSYQPPSGTPGLGLRFTDGGALSATVAFCPDHPTSKGSMVIACSGSSGGPVQFGPPAARFTFEGLGDQTLWIGAGTETPAPGKDAVTLSFELGAAQWNGAVGPLSADVAAPTLRLALHHDSAWHYSLSASLPRFGVTLDPSDLLAQAGIPIPIPVPAIDEHRSLSVQLDDGAVTVHEGAAA